MDEDGGVDLMPIRPAPGVRERIVAAAMVEIRLQARSEPPLWARVLELPARAATWVIPAAAALWLALALRGALSTPREVPPSEPSPRALQAAWGRKAGPALPAGLSADELLVRFAGGKQ